VERIGTDVTAWLSGYTRVVIVGVGNPLRRDDGVGVEAVKRLRGRIANDAVLLLESESVPESFIEPIVAFNPSHILIVDAALMGLESGSMKLTDTADVLGVTVSTHALPIQVFCIYLAQVTQSKIALLLIQPKNVNFGEELSTELEKAVTRIVEVFTGIFL
jgi:hydrogenase 3 maturation protease